MFLDLTTQVFAGVLENQLYIYCSLWLHLETDPQNAGMWSGNCPGSQWPAQGAAQTPGVTSKSNERHKNDLRFVWTSCSIAAVGCSELGKRDFNFQ